MDGQSLARVVSDSRLARRVGFGWGFAEGLFFFIVPDVFIGFAALFSLRAGVIAWLASIAGSAVALAVLYLLMVQWGLDYAGFLDELPGISTELVARVFGEVGAQGRPYTYFLFLFGVPLKVWAAAAFASGESLGAVLIWTVFARVVRIAPTVLGARLVRRLGFPSPETHPVGWCAAHVGFWVVFYAVYFFQMRG